MIVHERPVVVVDLLPREPGALPPGRRGTGGRNPEESRYRTRHRDPAKPDGWRRKHDRAQPELSFDARPAIP